MIYVWFGILKRECAWLANSTVTGCLRRVSHSAEPGGVPLILGVFCVWPTGAENARLPTSIGNESRAVGHTYGYYCWMASFVCLFIGAFREALAGRKTSHAE
ncbi:MAG: hypothetical protein EAZ24_07605 [Burkholderiales bacterium]|nr:MAG: hypothetical protein EAZ24_07605 [Burkholderiales bacterium]